MFTVIIPTYNNFDLYKRCIISVLKQTIHSRIVVINNGRDEQTLEFNKKHSNIITINPEKNLGFIRACNIGMKMNDDNIKWRNNILLLNDDTILIALDTLSRLQSFLALGFEGAYEKIGAIGPVSKAVIGTQSVDWNHLYKKPVHKNKFLIGFCMGINWEAYKKVGLLDERFGIGGNDDLDYSIRLGDAGFDLYVDRSTFVWHYGGATFNRLFGGYSMIEAETRPKLIEKYGQQRIDELLDLETIIIDND